MLHDTNVLITGVERVPSNRHLDNIILLQTGEHIPNKLLPCDCMLFVYPRYPKVVQDYVEAFQPPRIIIIGPHSENPLQSITLANYKLDYRQDGEHVGLSRGELMQIL